MPRLEVNFISQELEEILKEFEDPEQEKDRNSRRIEINSAIAERLHESLEEEQVLKIINYYNVLISLSPLDNLFYQGNVKFLDFTEIAKCKPSINPYWIPGAKVLIYSHEGMSTSSSSSSLMHHKFVVFLEKVENLFKSNTNPSKCWKCDCQIEQPDLSFWDETYDELISSGEDSEAAELISREWEIQCSHSQCGAHNTFYNPKIVSQYEDFFPNYNPRYKPIAVWTGSFNFTYSAATKHYENGVFIDSSDVADIYFQEWAKNCIISEKFTL